VLLEASSSGTGKPVVVARARLGAIGSRGIAEEARLCELAELDGVWHFGYEAPFSGTPELLVVLSQLATSTERCFAGSLVTDVVRRHPMVVAHAFATLSYLAPGRVCSD